VNEKTAIKKSIEHWERMVTWAKTQPKRARVDYETMYECISEDWFSTCCPLCQLCESNCRDCPLFLDGQGCGGCYGDSDYRPWNSVNESKTWGTWVKRAEGEMLPLLRRVVTI
jgi:hypothetical protein